MNESQIPRFPGWHVIGLLLPIVAVVGSMFVLIGAPHREGEWFTSRLPMCLRFVHVATFFGMLCGIASFFRWSKGLCASEYPLGINMVFAISSVALNALLFICLFPVWWMK